MPGHPAYRRVGERSDERTDRIGSVSAVRIGENEDLAMRRLNRGFQRCTFADPARGDQTHVLVAIGRNDLVSPVSRAVRDDDELTPIRGVIERQKVLDAIADHVRLVVSRDDDAHRRRDVRAGIRARAQAGAEHRQHRHTRVRDPEDGRREPEDRCPDHGRSPETDGVATSLDRRSYGRRSGSVSTTGTASIRCKIARAFTSRSKADRMR